MSKKRVSGAWVDDTPHIYNTSTDTFSTLPHEVIGDGTAISSYTIKGNMVQSGTPTPSNPVYPVETGDKTANLYDYKTAYSAYVQPNGDVTATAAQIYAVQNIYGSDLIGTEVTMSVKVKTCGSTYVSIRAFINGVRVDGNTIARGNTGTLKITVTPETANDYWFITYGSGGTDTYSDFMLNTGSTALTYEPFGYKIPILSNGNTYPIYLSEPIRAKATADVMSSTGTVTRAYKKVVLDSNTNIGTYTTQWGIAFVIYTSNVSSGTGSALIDAVCSHYDRTTRDNIWRQSGSTLRAITLSGENTSFLISDPTYTTLQDFKDYVAAQYNNGTPITVIVAVTTPTTEQFTAPSIPTSGSPQSFDVGTTLKPNEVSLTWHGWHEHSDEKYVGGVNLLTNTDFTSTTTDTRTYISLVFDVQQGNTTITRERQRIDETGVYTLTLVSTGVGDKVVVKHSGQTRDIQIANVSIPVQEGDKFIFTANFTGINPTVEGGIATTNMSLTNPKWE